MTQDERLEKLLLRFLADSSEYGNLRPEGGVEENRRMLRSLMNVREPGSMDLETLRLQDEYLRQRAEEKGIVYLSDIPTLDGQVKCGERLSLWQGDITRLAVDAIVNAANSEMLGCFVPMHNCIDNCIHTFAGVQLREECFRQMTRLRRRRGQNYRQPTAVPMLTDAYNLPAKKVIHIVGPIVQYGLTPKLEQDLSDCYKNTLDMCMDNNLRSAAFCCISTGVFHFPPERAAEIAVSTVTRWLEDHPSQMDRVIFNVYDDNNRSIYENLLSPFLS